MTEIRDPRVFFAAERNLLAWSRTSLTLMGFGFLVERFGLFLHLLPTVPSAFQRGLSFWVGLVFVTIGVTVSVLASLQFRKVVKAQDPSRLPEGYWLNLGVFTNLAVGLLGIFLIAYLTIGA